MLALKEKQQDCSIIEFPTNSLVKYLKDYDIRKQEFNYPVSDSDIAILKRYYDDTYDFAARQTLDDEYVGNSFDNLDTIKRLIK